MCILLRLDGLQSIILVNFTKAVIDIDAFAAKIDARRVPVRVILIDGYEDTIPSC